MAINRDNKYLAERIEYLWEEYFSDCPRLNEIKIKFGPKCFIRLGSIRSCNHKDDNSFDTLILVNGHYKNPIIPSYVIDATIVHELVHYIHGVSSPLPAKSKFPHRCGAVDKEFKKRNLEELATLENNWLKKYWPTAQSKLKQGPKVSLAEFYNSIGP